MPGCFGPLGGVVGGDNHLTLGAGLSASKRPRPISVSSTLSEDVNPILQSFRRSHFVWPRSDHHKGGGVREWIFDRAGYLDPFSRHRGVRKVVSKTADTWAHATVLRVISSLRSFGEKWRYSFVCMRVFMAVDAAPVCGSFSIGLYLQCVLLFVLKAYRTFVIAWLPKFPRATPFADGSLLSFFMD